MTRVEANWVVCGSGVKGCVKGCVKGGVWEGRCEGGVGEKV